MSVEYGTSVNSTSQLLHIQFDSPASPENHNRRFVGIMPSGIYQPRDVMGVPEPMVIVDPNTVGLLPTTFCFIAGDLTHTANVHHVRCETTDTVNITVTENSYIVARYQYQDIADWWCDIGAVAALDPEMPHAPDNEPTSEICFGKAICIGGVLDHFEYDNRDNTSLVNGRVRVSSSDRGTTKFLNEKLTPGNMISFNVLNTGGDEQLEIMTTFPIGAFLQYGADAAPDLWLLCDGTVHNIATYPLLGAVLGNKYGGDGVTTFAVPDMRGRVPVGFDTMVLGSYANRITKDVTGNSDTWTRTNGDSGGLEDHLLTISEIPAHTHSVPFQANPNGYFAPSADNVTRTGVSDSGSAGGGARHNNVQPSLVVNFIIYAGE